MLVVSCHADTNFHSHTLERIDEDRIHGHLDNFAGVHAVMRAYFSGRLAGGHVRIALTHGEEVDFAGARELLPSLAPDDLVLVVDVTGVEVDADLTLEKCRQRELRNWLAQTLAGLRVAIYEDTPDPVADADESDVYAIRCPFTCFVGVLCSGGDYNEGPVDGRESAIAAVSEAICRIAEAYADWQRVRPQLAAPASNSLQVELRPVRDADRADWLRMREALWPDALGAHAAEIDAYFAEAHEHGATFLAFDANAEALGFAEVALRDFAEGCQSSPVAYLEGIWVRPSSRRRGVARALLRTVQEWGRERGCRELASDAESSNIESLQFHQQLGFSVSGQLTCLRKLL